MRTVIATDTSMMMLLHRLVISASFGDLFNINIGKTHKRLASMKIENWGSLPKALTF
jgi:hypothetical protein